MKALIVITGRGLGGDAVIALNLIKALEDKGIICEIALDDSAPGLLFKKKGYSWYKIKIPQAGGHAATKITTIKAAFKMLKSIFQVRKIIKKNDIDFVVGVIGGGAIVGCVGAKLAKIPSVGVISTPLDSKICSKLNHCIALPETSFFRQNTIPDNITKSYFPINPLINQGNKDKALEKLIKEGNFDKNKKTILFSSGSSLFKGMVQGISNFSKINQDYNLVLIGIPLKEEYLDLINEKIINLGYIDWLSDLFDYIDLAVLTDDGLTLQEAIACEVPAIALTRVKYNRYHNMEGIFKGAVIETDLDQLNDTIINCMDNLDQIHEKSKSYSKDILSAKENIANIILNEVKK